MTADWISSRPVQYISHGKSETETAQDVNGISHFKYEVHESTITESRRVEYLCRKHVPRDEWSHVKNCIADLMYPPMWRTIIITVSQRTICSR